MFWFCLELAEFAGHLLMGDKSLQSDCFKLPGLILKLAGGENIEKETTILETHHFHYLVKTLLSVPQSI